VIKEKGMEISQLSDNEKKRWAEATKGILETYLARTGKTGQALVEEVNKLRP
jgi:TRAP-type C4-dicarboxylate transport system substrate-binding protein